MLSTHLGLIIASNCGTYSVCPCQAGQSERAKPGSILLAAATATSGISDQRAWPSRFRPDCPCTTAPGASAKPLSAVLPHSSGAHHLPAFCDSNAALVPAICQCMLDRRCLLVLCSTGNVVSGLKCCVRCHSRVAFAAICCGFWSVQSVRHCLIASSVAQSFNSWFSTLQVHYQQLTSIWGQVVFML